MTNRNQVLKAIKDQFENMQCMPLFEIEIVDEEYLLVNLSMAPKGIEFRFDCDNKPTHFSGEVIKTGDGVFLVKCDSFTDNLDSYLELISDEIMEGFLLPNNLLPL